MTTTTCTSCGRLLPWVNGQLRCVHAHCTGPLQLAASSTPHGAPPAGPSPLRPAGERVTALMPSPPGPSMDAVTPDHGVASLDGTRTTQREPERLADRYRAVTHRTAAADFSVQIRPSPSPLLAKNSARRGPVRRKRGGSEREAPVFPARRGTARRVGGVGASRTFGPLVGAPRADSPGRRPPRVVAAAAAHRARATGAARGTVAGRVRHGDGHVAAPAGPRAARRRDGRSSTSSTISTSRHRREHRRWLTRTSGGPRARRGARPRATGPDTRSRGRRQADRAAAPAGAPAAES